MYKSFRVRNFRALHNIRLDEMKRFNLVVGSNEVGKTSLLEAFLLHGNPQAPILPLLLDHWRSGRANFPPTLTVNARITEPWRGLFPWFALDEKIELFGDTDVGEWTLELRHVAPDPNRLVTISPALAGLPPGQVPSTQLAGTLELRYIPQGSDAVVTSVVVSADGAIGTNAPTREPLVRATFERSYAQDNDNLAPRLGKLQVEKRMAGLVQLLQIVEPRLVGLTTAAPQGGPLVYVDLNGPELLPLSLLGSGFQRVLRYATSIFETERGVVLMDEFDNGLHYSAIPGLLKQINDMLWRYDVQVVATTHSIEFLRTAVRSLGADEISVTRLEFADGHVMSRTVAGSALASLLEAGFELR